MICSKVFAICSILVLAICCEKCAKEFKPWKLNVAAVQHLTALSEKNPSFKYLRRLDKTSLAKGPSKKYELEYRLGTKEYGKDIQTENNLQIIF